MLASYVGSLIIMLEIAEFVAQGPKAKINKLKVPKGPTDSIYFTIAKRLKKP